MDNLLLAVMASANIEKMVPLSLVSQRTPLPDGVMDNKLAGCIIAPDFRDRETAFEVMLPEGDIIMIDPSMPITNYAGSSVNLAMIARALTLNVIGWFSMADDPDGKALFNHLIKRGVDVNSLECGATPLTIGIMDEVTAKTTLLMQKPSESEYSIGPELRRNIIFELTRRTPSVVAMTSIGAVELELVRQVAESLPSRVITVMIPRVSILGKPKYEEAVLRAMASCRLVVINRRELRHALNTFQRDDEFNPTIHLPQLVERLRDFDDGGNGERLLVVTCAADGEAAVIHRAGEVADDVHIQKPEPGVIVKETTGAGDAFALGMMLALVRKLPWKQALKWGAKLAVANSQGPGGAWAANHIGPNFFDAITD